MTTSPEFESAATAALRHALEWRSTGAKIPAAPTKSAPELRALLDIGLPDTGRDGTEVIDALARAAHGGLGANTHPNFFAWVMGASHPVGVAADMLTSAWGQNAGIYQSAPAAAIAEEVAGRWLLELLRLPASASIAFTTGATMASFICLAAARSETLKRAGYDLEQCGLTGAPPIDIFLGEEAHATILSGLKVLGFGNDNLRPVSSDGQGRMIALELERAMAQSSALPIVIAQAGHINSGAFDPFEAIADIAADRGAWLHIDGAFGLWARAVDSLAPLCAGAERADSWSVDGHKWLQLPYDSGFAIVRHPQAHSRAMNVTASYLPRGPEDGRNPSEFVPELSRRARGFAAWAVLQALGRAGVREMVERHCRCAAYLGQRLAAVPGIRVLNDVVLNQLALAFGSTGDAAERNRLTHRVIDWLAQENRHMVAGANWKGQAILRISIISHRTDIEHVAALADSIIAAWNAVSQTGA